MNRPRYKYLRISVTNRCDLSCRYCRSECLFKNKKDLTQVYLDVIQNRNIVLDGFIWPIDTLIIATSNNAEYNRFVSEEEEAPIKDRCRICYVGHNTDYILQQELTRYAIGSKRRTTITGEDMHEDPNLNFATSVGAVLTRLITQQHSICLIL